MEHYSYIMKVSESLKYLLTSKTELKFSLGIFYYVVSSFPNFFISDISMEKHHHGIGDLLFKEPHHLLNMNIIKI